MGRDGIGVIIDTIGTSITAVEIRAFSSIEYFQAEYCLPVSLRVARIPTRWAITIALDFGLGQTKVVTIGDGVHMPNILIGHFNSTDLIRISRIREFITQSFAQSYLPLETIEKKP